MPDWGRFASSPGTVGFFLGYLNRDVGEWTQVRPIQIAATVIVLVWFVFIGRTMKRMFQVEKPSPTG
ncbi:MAG: hypothetical protein H0V37_07840 [Chloroflexia bacterium]|nr:hypothetical protein [Chloroflexia bacterium]